MFLICSGDMKEGRLLLEKTMGRSIRSYKSLGNHDSGFYFSNGTGGEWFWSKGYYILSSGEFSKCEISQNFVYVGIYLVLVKKVLANAPNISN